MPGDPACTCGGLTRVFSIFHARLRVRLPPGIPHALFGRRMNQQLGRNASRGYGTVPAFRSSFRGDAKHRTMVRNCAAENPFLQAFRGLMDSGLALTRAPE